ncbi:MAG: aminotransferase class I/II-fold pyridoxal phosphate-dependent enzyme [Gemmatimonadetes bacterium]|nr:aminotransferase class I/II-fold pyridoxal phosphate-dependent enzyme [Gemmatimonadota bacterium]
MRGASDGIVDLRSDTVTRPSAGMREAIARAEVGDDALGDDPTVRALESRVAGILGKPASLFFPSGIMANQTALLLHTTPGTEVVCEASAHLVDWELAGAAANAGVQLRGVASSDGILTAEAVVAAIRPRAAKLQIQTSLISVENTHNAAGGRVVPLATALAIRDAARNHNLPVHMDGARLWNAAEAAGVTERDYAACADTVMVTLSKGLGCPVGSMLAGDEETIDRARVVRRRLGGSMRQSGILAAAGLYALDHNRSRLGEDHVRARRLAELSRSIPGLDVIEPETNIVMFDIARPDMNSVDVTAALEQRGVWMTVFTQRRVRAVTHLDIDDAGIERAAAVLAEVVGEGGRGTHFANRPV